MPNNVKCKDCGLLCITGSAMFGGSIMDTIPAPEPPVFIEATRRSREHMSLGITGELTCFAEEPQWAQDLEREKKVAPVLEFERNCESFIPYVLGHSPKEHIMLKLQERLEKREDVRDRVQLEWQERQEERADKRHTETLRTAKEAHGKDLKVFGVIVTTIIVIITLLSAAIAANWIPDPWWVT